MPRRLDHVQGMRGVLMLAIVIYHCDLPPTGAFVGIDAFFVISGYVITGLLLREVSSTGRIRLGAFYLRRIRRLLPALALMLIVVAALSALFESPLTGQRTTGRVGAYASVSLANLALYRTRFGYFDQQSESITLRHTWSLSVEEQIYLIFPLLVLLVLVVGHRSGNLRRRRLVWALGAVALASFVVLLVMAYEPKASGFHRPQSAAYYLPFTRVWEFAAGALVAVWHVSRPALTARVASCVGAVGAASAVGAIVFFSSEAESSNPALLVPVVGTTLVLAACRTGGVLARVLSWRPLVWVGDRSYGWYLWHWPLIVLARNQWPDNTGVLLGAAALALLVTMVTYRFVEERFRHPRKHVPERAQTRSGIVLAAACFLVPIVVMMLLGEAARRNWDNATVRTMSAQLLPRPAGEGRLGCPLERVETSGSLDTCTVGTGTDPIYLLGDSNAGQFADGLVQVADRLGRPLVLFWRPGCSYIDVTVQRADYDVAGCDRYNSAVTDWLIMHRGASVVVANSGEFLDASGVALRDRTTGARADGNDPTGKRAVWRTALTRSLQVLRTAHQRVVLLGMLAHPGGVDDQGQDRWDPLTCGLAIIVLSTDRCGLTVPLADEDDRQADALAIEAAAAEHVAGAQYVNLRTDVCPDGACRAVRDGRWVYRNSLHITVGESRRLTPALSAIFRPSSG